MDALEVWQRNADAYERMLPQLLERYPQGSFALIRQAELAGVFPTEEEAMEAGAERPTPYFVQVILPMEDQVIHSSF